jgi:DNA-directed RNA polymerase specialized sigma24 family protein
VAGATSAIRAAESRARWAGDVAAALATLRPDQRSFVQLSYFDGVPHTQIAEQARLPVESVSRAIAAGMLQLARVLEGA